MTLLGRMHQYPKLFPQFIPRFKLGTRITTNLNLRYCKIQTQTLSQNLALYKGINGVVAFTCYWLHWLRIFKGKSQFCIIRRRTHNCYLEHIFTTNLPENYFNHELDELSTSWPIHARNHSSKLRPRRGKRVTIRSLHHCHLLNKQTIPSLQELHNLLC